MESFKDALLKYVCANTDAIMDQNALQAPCSPSDQKDGVTWPDRFDQLMSFRDFLCLKKEVLEVYEQWKWEHGAWPITQEIMRTHDIGAMEAAVFHRAVTGDELPTEAPNPVWPEALKGLTREDIEILKM